jgi:hypothetical protein
MLIVITAVKKFYKIVGWSTLKFKFSIKSVEKEFLFNQRKIVSSKNSFASISFGFENVTKSHCWGLTKMPPIYYEMVKLSNLRSSLVER